jgi:hypothetical protein
MASADSRTTKYPTAIQSCDAQLRTQEVAGAARVSTVMACESVALGWRDGRLLLSGVI